MLSWSFYIGMMCDFGVRSRIFSSKPSCAEQNLGKRLGDRRNVRIIELRLLSELLLEKLLRSLGGGMNLSVDEQASGLRATGAVELPRDLVAFPRELGPF